MKKLRKQKKQKRYPKPTVDIIISYRGGIILIKRKNPPYGWAIPGGFIEYNERAEATARREAKEETNLDLLDLKQFHTYSNPGRDPRGHTVSIVFTARGKGTLKARTDASQAGIFTKKSLPRLIAFDHRRILKDYFNKRFL